MIAFSYPVVLQTNNVIKFLDLQTHSKEDQRLHSLSHLRQETSRDNEATERFQFVPETKKKK